jgi:hypothetical protein
MAVSIVVKPKKVTRVRKKRGPGRPFAGGRDPIVGVRMPPQARQAVEAWAEDQDDKPTLSEATRRLIAHGLETWGRRK